jgi:hypothetical protein
MKTRNSKRDAALLLDPRVQLGSPSSRHGLQSFFDRGDQFVYHESLAWNGWRPGISSGYHIASERLIVEGSLEHTMRSCKESPAERLFLVPMQL